MTTGPLVSIILPTYNRARLLPRAVGSVLKQTWTNWELVILDDGSVDETPLLLERMARDDKRVRVFRHANIGPGETRNRGLKNSCGEYVAFLDSDDEYLPRHIELRARFLLEHPDVDFLHGGVALSGPFSRLAVPDALNPSRTISVTECAVGGTFFARRPALEQSSGWTSGYAEDFRLLEELSLRIRVVKVDFPTYVYHRESDDSRCSNFRPEN